MSDRAMLTGVALVLDGVVVAQAAGGIVDPPTIIVAVIASFCAALAWFAYKERRR